MLCALGTVQGAYGTILVIIVCWRERKIKSYFRGMEHPSCQGIIHNCNKYEELSSNIKKCLFCWYLFIITIKAWAGTGGWADVNSWITKETFNAKKSIIHIGRSHRTWSLIIHLQANMAHTHSTIEHLTFFSV